MTCEDRNEEKIGRTWMHADPDKTETVADRQETLDFGPPRPLVREPRSGERRRVQEVLGRAFFDDPVSMFLFPDERRRETGFAAFTGLAIDAFGADALVLTNEAVQGAAIWQRPSPGRPGWSKQLRMGVRMLWVIRGGFRKAIGLGEFMNEHHLQEPHYYLAALGTDPAFQGSGIGSALIQPVLECCDTERKPAYLESSKRSNIPFYNKHGFEVIEELQIPGGPSIWPMIRRTG